MRIIAGTICTALLLGSAALAQSSPAAASTTQPSPIFVELFTSEGCSTCPPADALLARIGQVMPNAIVLEEHVTYWNQGGWIDPYSSDGWTSRQDDYKDHFHLNDVYTPQMVIDGRYQFVGSNGPAAQAALRQADADPKIPLAITSVAQPDSGKVNFHLTAGAPPKKAELFVVAVQNSGVQQVEAGENKGTKMQQAAIARSVRHVATLKPNQNFDGNVVLDLPHDKNVNGWHLVAFLQQGSGGPILGAASHSIDSVVAQAK
ncbi:MAG TPA: DUF1223 domain-containing protein [Acidobacteriaceae bacterium]|jgi:hypothetical protein|nr:DUF1223 domain-containing protein [Acidobacteriaceae bacterium]